jgi:hypothetical protein
MMKVIGLRDIAPPPVPHRPIRTLRVPENQNVDKRSSHVMPPFGQFSARIIWPDEIEVKSFILLI